jgi:IS5 family transposase
MPIVHKVPPPRVPDPIPQKFTREQAIERLLAHGLTLAEIQAEEEQVAALHAVALLRARYWTAPAVSTPAPLAPPPPSPPPAPAAAPAATVRYRVRNWKDYNQALIRRGSLTVWIEQATLHAWCQNTRAGLVGAPTTYSDLAIQALLTLKAVFSLPLRQTQGFAQSVLQLMASDLPIPDYSTLSRRADGLAVALPRRTKDEPLHVVIDSTGLKIYGEGEWKTRQHGVSKRRTWRKMHLGVDEASGEIVAVVTTERDVGDCEVLPQLLEAIEDEIAQVSADGAYDTIACHQAIAARQAKAAIPPRENAVITDIGQWDAREQAVRRIEEIGRPAWKQEVNYHRRSLAETMMFRQKAIFGDRLSSRKMTTQTTEVRIRCAALNRMTHLGMPQSVCVPNA